MRVDGSDAPDSIVSIDRRQTPDASDSERVDMSRSSRYCRSLVGNGAIGDTIIFMDATVPRKIILRKSAQSCTT